MEGNEVKDKKALKIINIIVSIIFSIFIIFEIFIFISYFAKKNNTIYLCGGSPYIALYSDDEYNFEDGDLVITYKEQLFNDKVVLKHDKNNITVILTGEQFKLNKNKENASNIFSVKIHWLGKFILFMRELYAVLVTIIIVSAIYLIMFILRFQSNNEYTKQYKTIRIIKDVIILAFIICSYIDIFLIGKIDYKFAKDEKNIYGMNTIQEQNTIENNFTNDIGNTTENVENNVNNLNIVKNNINGSNVNNNRNNNNDSKDNSSNDDIIDTGINFEVTENSKSWSQIENLGIFKNEFLKSNKIYPGISGKYEFKVENKSDFYINYKINMEVLSNYNVNLKYKIIKNGEYLNTEYKYINEINIPNYDLANGSKDTYIIEWKWIDNDSADTLAGQNADLVKYSLKISISGSQK